MSQWFAIDIRAEASADDAQGVYAMLSMYFDRMRQGLDPGEDLIGKVEILPTSDPAPRSGDEKGFKPDPVPPKAVIPVSKSNTYDPDHCSICGKPVALMEVNMTRAGFVGPCCFEEGM